MLRLLCALVMRTGKTEPATKPPQVATPRE